MLEQFFSDSEWRAWVAPAAGAAAAVLALVFGYYLLRRSTPVSTPVGPPRAKNGMPQADPFLYGSATERRDTLRRKGTHVKVVLANADATEELGWSWVIDRSMTGLCLKVDQEVPAGTILSVRPLKAPETPWLQVEVKNCRPMGEHWEIGCQFLRQPAWSVLMLFG
jgi:hypothetical protein